MKVKFDPHKGCPMCGRLNLDDDMHTANQETIHWNMKCNDCGFQWIDVFEWTHSITADGTDDELYVTKGEQ